MFRNCGSQNKRWIILLLSVCVSVHNVRDGAEFVVNWGGITHLTLICCLTLGHLLYYIMEFSPKSGDQTFNSECREVSLMQHGCKKAELSKGVGPFELLSTNLFITCCFLNSHCADRVFLGCCSFFKQLGMCRTSLKDLLDLDVVGTEATVELEVVSVVEEGPSKRKQ